MESAPGESRLAVDCETFTYVYYVDCTVLRTYQVHHQSANSVSFPIPPTLPFLFKFDPCFRLKKVTRSRCVRIEGIKLCRKEITFQSRRRAPAWPSRLLLRTAIRGKPSSRTLYAPGFIYPGEAFPTGKGTRRSHCLLSLRVLPTICI